MKHFPTAVAALASLLSLDTYFRGDLWPGHDTYALISALELI